MNPTTTINFVLKTRKFSTLAIETFGLTLQKLDLTHENLGSGGQ